MIVRRGVLSSPRNIEQLLHGLCTWPRIDWIWEWRQLSLPKPWQFQERVMTKVSNVLHDIFMVILTMVPSPGRNEHSCFVHRC